MYLKTKVCDGQLTESIHYIPTAKDISNYYDDPNDFDSDDEEFGTWLAEEYEHELQDAHAAGYDDLNDYFYDLKHGGINL